MTRILILYTGGTFGMETSGKSSASHQLPDVSPEVLSQRLKRFVPELERLAHCEVEVAFNRDSAHIGPREWVYLAETIQKRWEDYDGIVLLHGTDTLSYTACALSFLLRPCLKPVILTGAQRPLASIRSDARRNLISAVEICAQASRKKSLGRALRQVLVFFDERLFQGNRVRKRSATEFEAFESPQAPPVAVVGTTIRYRDLKKSGRKKTQRTVHMSPQFSEKVAMLHLTPGFPSRAIARDLVPKVSGLILVAFPSGTAPTHDPELIGLLQAAKRSEVPVVIVAEGITLSPFASQAIHPSNYAAGLPLLEEGCFWAGTMTPEAAYVKASWILGQLEGRGGSSRQAAQKGRRQKFATLWKQDFSDEGCAALK